MFEKQDKSRIKNMSTKFQQKYIMNISKVHMHLNIYI